MVERQACMMMSSYFPLGFARVVTAGFYPEDTTDPTIIE